MAGREQGDRTGQVTGGLVVGGPRGRDHGLVRGVRVGLPGDEAWPRRTARPGLLAAGRGEVVQVMLTAVTDRGDRFGQAEVCVVNVALDLLDGHAAPHANAVREIGKVSALEARLVNGNMFDSIFTTARDQNVHRELARRV